MRKIILFLSFLAALLPSVASAQYAQLPLGEQCFSALSATSGGTNGTGTGYVGLLGTITAGTGGTAGAYGGVALTGGTGTGATANVTVGSGVTAVAILNPGVGYSVGDVLSATSGNIGGVSGFSVPVSSVAINSALAGGSVGYYIPNTLSTKQTFQNSAGTVLNSNPVALDANGCAIVYGSGVYRQILKDSLGNTVWDTVTTPASPSGPFWAGLAGGTGNSVTVTDTAFSNQDGYLLQFLAKAANNGPTFITVSGGTPIQIVNDTGSGPAALSGGEIAGGNVPLLTYDATNVEFHIINPAATSGSGGSASSLTPPQGYLNLVGQATGDVIQTGDVVAATTVFYSPYVGNTIPIWNGSVFKQVVFSELTTTLTAAGSPLSTIQDECVFSNNGVPTLVTGPQWTTATPNAGNRGSSAAIQRQQGIWVNSISIVGYNGLSSYTIPANQCTYVGSLWIDATAGQVSAYRSAGQSRKFGIWNAYNRQTIQLDLVDLTANWANTPTTWRQSHGDATNFASSFSGLPEEIVSADFAQFVTSSCSSTTAIAEIGIGINSTTASSGLVGENECAAPAVVVTVGSTVKASTTLAPALGINQFNAIEQAPFGTTANTYNGSVSTRLSIKWRG